MNRDQIERALQETNAETDPTEKNLKLASICTALFAEEGIDLVVVGGSAIEFYTEGAYTSGDVDLCVASTREPLTVRRRQELMGRLGGVGGPRSWQVAGGFIDILGDFENLARTALRRINAPYGQVCLSPVEELLVERILIASYPDIYLPARACAQKLIAAALNGEVEVDWEEVRRLAERPEYANFTQVKKLVHETAKTLSKRSPYHSDE